MRFSGQWGYYTDYETGPGNSVAGSSLLLLSHRYYDPATGRFVNRDPIGYSGGINLYGFAGGNPVNRIDPDGTDADYALKIIARYRQEIIDAANGAGIQPELLASVVFAETSGGTIGELIPNWHEINNDSSIIKFARMGKGSIGITQITFEDKQAWPTDQKKKEDLFRERLVWANAFNRNKKAQLAFTAAWLKKLASSPNRYPNRVNNLTRFEVGIVLTKYNWKPTGSPASKAFPSQYGWRSLYKWREIQQALGVATIP